MFLIVVEIMLLVTDNYYLNFHFINDKTSPEITLLQVFFLGSLRTPLQYVSVPAWSLFPLVFMIP